MITEDQLEQLAIQWFQDTGWNHVHGAVIAPEAEPKGPSPQPSPRGRGRNTSEREDFRAVVLKGRLAEAVRRLNPKLPESAVEEVVHVVTKPEHISLEANNRAFHRMLIDGVRVEFVPKRETYREALTPALSQGEREEDGGAALLQGEREEDERRVVDHAQLVDFENPSRNDFLVVNQFTVTGTKKPRRPDLVCFVNGLPLGLIELKNPADQQADVWKAFDQLQTYQAEISDLLVFNEALVVSDGMNARVGSLTASKEWFMPWRTISNENDKPQVEFELEKVVRGFFRPDLFDLRPRANPAGDLCRSSMSLRSILDYVRYFILFEQDGDGLIKKIAGYHQFHGVREAVRVTLIASATEDFSKVKEDRATYGKEVVPGSKKAGVFWHTQGSGKSISMCCYAGKLLQQPEMNNPTLVVVTDRNDLDGQLYTQFCSAKDLLKQTPEQAESREQLREMLASRKSGGIIFTTIQKFGPPAAGEWSPSPPAPLPGGEGGKRSYRGGFSFAGLVERARELRETQTPAEEMLWQLLRNRQLGEAKFRRQHQFGDYICDFYCHEAGIVVECDGEVHDTAEAKAHDKKRDAYLKSQGLTVIRFQNKSVFNDTENVLQQIANELPSPLGRGAGGEGAQHGGDSVALNTRTNIVVISDEAHRSQYGTKGRLDTKTGKYVYGYAKHMRDALPGASFIGFTGTPIEKADANTQETFGGYVSIYDIEDAKEDKATVPIYYESRLAKLDINREQIDALNKDVEEVIEDEEDVSARESTKGKWAELAKLVGAKERVEEIAADLVEHYETRTSVLEGKAMIVAMSRDICVSLFDEIIKLRPEWAGTKLTKEGKDIGWNHEDGAIRIVMTGTASDRPGLQDHVYSKGQKKRLAKRFKDAKDPLKLVIVRDMWLTGFDAPCCHTMYVDKPMAGHMERRTPIRRVHEMPMLGGKPLSIDSPWASAIRRSPLLDRKLAGDRGDDPDGQGHAGGDEAPRSAGPESGRRGVLRCAGGSAGGAAEYGRCDVEEAGE